MGIMVNSLLGVMQDIYHQPHYSHYLYYDDHDYDCSHENDDDDYYWHHHHHEFFLLVTVCVSHVRNLNSILHCQLHCIGAVHCPGGVIRLMWGLGYKKISRIREQPLMYLLSSPDPNA